MASIKKQFVTKHGLDANSYNISNVLDPVNDQDALTKILMESKATKDSVKLATLTNIPYGGFSSGVITISNPTLTFTSVTSDTIPLTGHSFNTGDLIQLNPSVQDGSNFLAVGGTSQTTTNTTGRYAIKVDANNIKIATSEANAFVGTSTTLAITGTVTVTVKVFPGIDGTAFVLNDRVLVKNQTTTAQNGIYTVTNITANAWVLTRASDFNSWIDVVGASTVVEQGSILSDTGWFCTSNTGGTLNTTAITFACNKSNGLTLNPKYTTSPILDISNTWYSAATTFTGVKLNITDTASSSTSSLLDLQVGNVSKFTVSKTGDAVVNGITVGVGSGNVLGNTAVGSNALIANTTGPSNTAIGFNAQAANTTGSSNTSIGYNTQPVVSTGFENTSVGAYSLETISTGTLNTAVGVSALMTATLHNNTAIGAYAMEKTTTGIDNAALGVGTLNANTTGSSNTALGPWTMENNTTGSNNIAIGYNAGNGITTGSNNTIIGSNVTGLSTSLASNIILANGTGTIKLQHDGATGWLVSDKVAIGGALSTSVNLYTRGPLDGTATTLYSTYNNVDITSSTATTAIINASATTVNASATSLTSITHFRAAGQTTMPVVPTNQYGFYAHSNISGATNNYGFHSNIAAATGRYNFYAAGTAENYFAGKTTSNDQFAVTGANDVATGAGQIYLNGATGNRIDFNNNGIAAPTFTTRSVGTKLCLWSNVGAAAVDYAVGVETDYMWFSANTSAHGFKWYGGTTLAAQLIGNGNLTIASNLGVGITLGTTPTAQIQISAGTTAAGSAPIKLTSGSLMTTAEAGAIEFLTDSFYGTITTGAARKTFAFLESPTFTGTPAAPTATAGTNTTQLATTAFVTTADNLKANLASPTFTGTPAAPTATAGTNTTQLATTAFVIANDDPAKANLASPTFTGTPAAPTAAAGTATTQIATTAFVDAAISAIVMEQNSKSAAYTLVAADSGKHILHPSADTTARTFTIPANSSVAFAIGTAITFINQNGAGNITIAITTDTMRLAGVGSTGSRTLTANGVATAVKITSTEWIISGTGLS